LGTGALAGQQVSLWYLILACSGSLLVYHADRAFHVPSEDYENAPNRVSWYHSHRPYLLVTSFVAIGLAGISTLFLPFEVLLLGAGLGVLGMIYGIIIPGTGFRVKDVTLAKTLLIIVCWVFGSVILPLKGSVSSAFLLLLAGYKVVTILPNILIADWIDKDGDKKHGVMSSGVWLGWNGVRYTTLGCLLIGIIAVNQISHFNGMLWLSVIDLVGLAIMTFVVWRSSKNSVPDIIYFDLLVGFSLVTWLLWLLVR